MKKLKLELTWIGKENWPKLEPRILLEDPLMSYHAKQWVTENDIFSNQLIFGDNLLALKALEAEFAGKVKCVFIDPQYNTGSAFTHYDGSADIRFGCLSRMFASVLLASPARLSDLFGAIAAMMRGDWRNDSFYGVSHAR